ncbi:MAG: hypothetical protein HFH53_02830 [Hespellia sp.]|nr:hypothetical protein [Hespellia sp.]
MFYKQIILKKELSFAVKLPVTTPAAIESLS